MLDINFIRQTLGKYYDQPDVDTLLSNFEIKEKLKLKKGEVDAYLSSKKHGIEITFSIESSLKERTQTTYPDGALVITNIRFYGVSTSDFDVYQGVLPSGIFFRNSKKELESTLGTSSWRNPILNSYRWKNSEYQLMAVLNDEEELEICSIQLLTA